jgi:hypothetical protein
MQTSYIVASVLGLVLILLVACSPQYPNITTKEIKVIQPTICEKTFNTTKYREEKTPFGEPRCEQVPYNFSFKYFYSDEIENNQRIAVCRFDIKNEENMAGKFVFHTQITKGGDVIDGADKEVSFQPLETKTLIWREPVEITDSASCLLYASQIPNRIRCFYLEPITYAVKRVPYVVQTKRNVTC